MNTDVQVNQRDAPINKVPDLAPARILEIELGQSLPAIASRDKRERSYRRALCLVRLHTQPLGVVEFQFDEQGVSAVECARQVWQHLGEQINEHLRQDALPQVRGLDPGGLPVSTAPRCVQEREEFLAHAPFVSIIVPTHDRPETLTACLRSLLALRYPHYEIIIVDNAPGTLATAALVSEISQDAPQVRYLREERPGVSWARNCGMVAAKGYILAFTDDDVVVDPYWLVELVRGFSRAENVACVTGYNLPMELETPAQFWYEAYGGACWFQENGGTSWEFTRHIYDMQKHRAKTPLYPYRAGMFGCGASMAFTAAFLRSTQGFDPALGGNGPSRCGQDIAVFFQVITRGYTLVYEPAALIYHLHRRDYPALRRQIYNYGVGMTAYLTKSLLAAPHLLFDFSSKALLVFFWFLGNRSARPRKMPAHYPKELVKIRQKGMLYGPLAYMQSRRMMRKVEQAFFAAGEKYDVPPDKEGS
jgi:GT2 family glycosyltransferase